MGRLKFLRFRLYVGCIFVEDQTQTCDVLVQHVGPKVMTCWTNRLLTVVVVVKFVNSIVVKLLRVLQAYYQLFKLAYQQCMSPIVLNSNNEIYLRSNLGNLLFLFL